MQEATQHHLISADKDYHSLWLRYLEIEKGSLPSTLKLYGRVLEIVTLELGDPSVLSSESLRTWLHSKRGAASTVSNRISALTSYYRYLVRTGVRVDNPCDKLDRPRRHKGIPKPVVDLIGALDALDALDRHVDSWGTGRLVGESRAMAVLLYETGLRIHEAVALDVPMPCPDSITIVGKGHKEARILLTAQARKALNFLGGRWPIKARATQRRFEKVGINPHALRHSLGCALAAAGADLGEIQDVLRHANPNTTRGYAAYSDDRLRKAQARRAQAGL